MLNTDVLMSKLKQNLPELTFFAFSIRLIALGASIGDAIALVSLVGIFGFFRFLDRKKVEQYDYLEKEIENLKNGLQSVKVSQGLTRGKLNEQKADSNKRYF